jgi:hypothetical protein
MKLRNNKEYFSLISNPIPIPAPISNPIPIPNPISNPIPNFNWIKVLYKAQLISSRGMIVPVRSIDIKTQIKKQNYSHIEIVNTKYQEGNKIIEEGLTNGFLYKYNNRIITRFLPFHSDEIFFREISFQLKKSGVNNIIKIIKIM